MLVGDDSIAVKSDGSASENVCTDRMEYFGVVLLDAIVLVASIGPSPGVCAGLDGASPVVISTGSVGRPTTG